MKFKSGLYHASLLLLLISFQTFAQPAVPETLTGNWLKVDGSNQFVLGLYKNIACFKNNTAVITAVSGKQDHWHLKLATGSLDIVRKDSHTIVLTDNGSQQILKNIQTVNDAYKPVEHTFKQPLFETGTATLKGYVALPAPSGKTLPDSYIMVSYENEFTGERDYFPAGIDNTGQFSVTFKLYRPQLCAFHYNGQVITTFLAQPGNKMLIAVSNTHVPLAAKPEYDQLLQYICFMGDNAAFNMHYLHYIAYNAKMKKQGLRLEDRATLEQIYPPAQVEQRFRDFIHEQIVYKEGNRKMNDHPLKDTSAEKLRELNEIYTEYLAHESPTALLHTYYYELAGRYGEKLAYMATSGRTRVPQERIFQLVEDLYAPVLPQNFLQQYRILNKDWDAVVKMSAAQRIDTYFNGDKAAYDAFDLIKSKLDKEVLNHNHDSVAFELFKKECKTQGLRFAASLFQLLYNSYSNSNDNVLMPSVYRLNQFNTFSEPGYRPYELTEQINRKRFARLGQNGLQLQIDTARVLEINNETDWQATLKHYRGRVVVAWIFPALFSKLQVVKSLYELRKAQELNKGRNVVFLKCVRQRVYKDKTKQLRRYLQFIEQNGPGKDILYVDDKASLMWLADKTIDSNYVIFDRRGQPHHPLVDTLDKKERIWKELHLYAQLDTLLAGKGRFYEGKAPDFFYGDGGVCKDPNVQMWSRFDSSGIYQTYVSNGTDYPVDMTNGLVMNSLVFKKGDDVVGEFQVLMTKEPKLKTDSSGKTDSFEYVPHKIRSEMYTYQFFAEEQRLRFYEEHMVRNKSYRVVVINKDIMVLELLE
jgi:hypothetical protein